MQTVSTQNNSLLNPLATRPEIEELLADILQSPPFRNSRQCQDLFRYVVEHSLNGSDESLRERVIGISVFGRSPDYDTAEDPVVRLRAADVRKRLAQYYQAKKSPPGTWNIDIPTGSYKAQFHPPETPAPQLPLQVLLTPPRSDGLPSIQPDLPAPRTRSGRRIRSWAVALLLGIVAVLSATLILRRTGPSAENAFDQFWKPVLDNKKPVLVCTGSNPVYLLSEESRGRYRRSHLLGPDATPNLEMTVPKEELKNFKIEDFVPVKDTYLTVGDASATAQMASLLSSRHHAYDLRFGSDLSFGDLRQGSAVLIGAFNNSWTLNMTDNLRYVFAAGDTPEMHVQDRFDNSSSWWPKFSDGKFSEDYAIISRILDSKTGSVLVTIAGLDHTGTRAAGDFVTNPQPIIELMKQAPKDWTTKNVQIVLHTNVLSNIPSSPTVVAVHYW
jgi:hypothetical protein